MKTVWYYYSITVLDKCITSAGVPKTGPVCEGFVFHANFHNLKGGGGVGVRGFSSGYEWELGFAVVFVCSFKVFCFVCLYVFSLPGTAGMFCECGICLHTL